MNNNDNDISGKVGLDTSDFKAGIGTLNQQIKVIDSGFRAAAAGMTDWGKSADGLKARIDSLNKITDLQKQKIAGLSDQYRKVAAEKGADSKAARDLEIRINKETEALNKSETELKRCAAALDDMGEEADQAADKTKELETASTELNGKLQDLGGKATKAAALGIAGIGSAALGAGVGLLKFADESTKAMNGFQAQTGATAEEMEGFKDVAKDVFADNFGDSVEDIANAMAQINQVTKQTGEELKRTTEQAILLRDTFGFEVNESVNTANSMMQKFGITSEQAFTLMAQGAQNGANKNGDLLEVLNEYAPQFSALGFSAEQFTDILIQGSKDGAFQIDKVGDAIKEFTIRSKDLSDTTNEAFSTLGFDALEMGAAFAAGGDAAQGAFKKVITRLGEIENPLLRNQIGVALFGTQFEDLEATSILALGNVKSEADSTADTLAKMNEVKYNDLGTSIDGLKRKIVGAFDATPIVQDLTAAINGINVAPLVGGLQWIIDNAGTLAAGAAAIGAGMITWNVISIVMGLVKAFKGWQVATTGMSVAQAALNLVMAANPIGILITVIAALVAGLIVLWNTNEGFRNAVIGLWTAISGAVVGTVKGITAFVRDNWKNITKLFYDPVGAVVGLLYNLNPKFRAWVDAAFQSVKTGLGQWKDIGKGIIDGITQGVINAAAKLASSVVNAAKGALDGAKKFLGIKSPSRLFKEQVGAQIGAGMAAGIADSGKQVDRAMAGINTKLVSSIDISRTGASGSGSGSVVVNVPLYLDGQQITRSTGSIQQGRNKSRSRALGVVPG